MDNQEIVRYFYETLVSENRVDELAEFVSPDCTLRVGETSVPLGLSGMAEHLAAVRRTYPDYTMKLVRQFTDGAYVISEFVMHGTHEGEFVGIRPSGKQVSITGVDIDCLADGKIVEHGGAANTFEGLLEQHLIGPV